MLGAMLVFFGKQENIPALKWWGTAYLIGGLGVNYQRADDITLAQQSHAVFLRSPYAHARIRSLSTAEAQKAPGVLGIYTGEHFKAVGGLPCGWLINNLDGTPMKEPKHPVLADGKVRYVGDRVALVVAETIEQLRRFMSAGEEVGAGEPILVVDHLERRNGRQQALALRCRLQNQSIALATHHGAGARQFELARNAHRLVAAVAKQADFAFAVVHTGILELA